MKPTLQDIQTVVRLQLGLRQVGPDDHLVEDLGAVSADIVNIVAALEEKYDFTADEQAMGDLRSVRDLLTLVEQQQ